MPNTGAEGAEGVSQEPGAELFLIAHRVRGQPAFDIAHRLRCAICGGVGGYQVPDFETGVIADYEGPSCDECNGDGFWWIIPTSGHRAYPYGWWNLAEIELSGYPPTTLLEWITKPPMPPTLPDHYAANDRPSTEPTGFKIDLKALGLVRPKPTIDRRI